MKQTICKILVAILILELSDCAGPKSEVNANPEINPPQSSVSNRASIDLGNYEALTKEYLEPLALSSITVETWNNPDEILPHRFGLFYVAKMSSGGAAEIPDWDSTSIDAKDVEVFI